MFASFIQVLEMTTKVISSVGVASSIKARATASSDRLDQLVFEGLVPVLCDSLNQLVEESDSYNQPSSVGHWHHALFAHPSDARRD